MGNLEEQLLLAMQGGKAVSFSVVDGKAQYESQMLHVNRTSEGHDFSELHDCFSEETLASLKSMTSNETLSLFPMMLSSHILRSELEGFTSPAGSSAPERILSSDSLIRMRYLIPTLAIIR